MALKKYEKLIIDGYKKKLHPKTEKYIHHIFAYFFSFNSP